jgi:hypothetical protein
MQEEGEAAKAIVNNFCLGWDWNCPIPRRKMRE